MSESPEDLAAARWVDGLHNRWFLDPLFLGTYPDDMLEAWAELMPEVHEGDLELISTPIDFLGVNNYTSPLVAADDNGGRSQIVRRNDVDRTDMGWEVVPDGLQDLLLRLHHDYQPAAIYVTENGAAYADVRGHDGSVNDPERQSYLESYLAGAARATAEGVPLRGYFAWSLLDNFEWAWGYWKRFGLIYIDYATLERVPKGSFYWYRDFIAKQRLADGGDRRSRLRPTRAGAADWPAIRSPISPIGRAGRQLGQRALVHDEDPVVERQDLVQVLADQQHGGAALGRLEQERVHLLDRRDVEAARRRPRDEHARARAELARDHDLLQVAAREVVRLLVGPGRLDLERLDRLHAVRPHRREPQERPARVRAERLECEVHRDREARSDAGAEAVLGHIADPGLERRPRVAHANRHGPRRGPCRSCTSAAR